MKIVLDTVTKRTICPPDFFENIRRINDASELTKAKAISPEEYLEKVINDCKGVIISKKELPKNPTGQAKNRRTHRATIGSLTIEPNNE